MGASSPLDDAKSDALDPDLVELTHRWPDLDEVTRVRIMALVRG
ncbi:MAG: hypothetical protein U0840_27800 [Gemmataceae bacterium]